MVALREGDPGPACPVRPQALYPATLGRGDFAFGMLGVLEPEVLDPSWGGL